MERGWLSAVVGGEGRPDMVTGMGRTADRVSGGPGERLLAHGTGRRRSGGRARVWLGQASADARSGRWGLPPVDERPETQCSEHGQRGEEPRMDVQGGVERREPEERDVGVGSRERRDVEQAMVPDP